MKKIGVIAVLVMAGAWAYGIGPIGVGGYHIVGIPMGESTFEATKTLSIMGTSLPLTYDITSGYSWKMNPANFGLGSTIYFVPWFAADGGFEMHTGYKNKAATVGGTLTVTGMTGPVSWAEDEDNVTWKMMNIYFGPRFAYAVNPSFRILGRAGLLYSLSSKLEYAGKFEGEALTEDLSAKGSHLGTYFGGGLNYFVIPSTFAITGLYTYNKLFEGTYTYEPLNVIPTGVPIPGITVSAYEAKWKPAAYVTLATGVEYYF